MAKSPQKPPKLKSVSSFRIERQYSFSYIAGVDEVGRGCLAGPVVVAGVVFPSEFRTQEDHEFLSKIDDSKKVSAHLRAELSEWIKANAIAWSLASTSEREIDEINILRATFQAARAVVADLHQKLGRELDLILMDGNQMIPGLKCRQQCVIGGDSLSKSIAAASIVAKAARDQQMTDLDKQYPGYDFGIHKGYATAKHREALKSLGPSPIHRISFLKKLLAQERGRAAEDLVCEFLIRKGFQVMERNCRIAKFEIDVVAEKDSEIHFFEVRGRSGETPMELEFPQLKRLNYQRAIAEFRKVRKLPMHRCRVHYASVVGSDISPLWDVFQL